MLKSFYGNSQGYIDYTAGTVLNHYNKVNIVIMRATSFFFGFPMHKKEVNIQSYHLLPAVQQHVLKYTYLNKKALLPWVLTTSLSLQQVVSAISKITDHDNKYNNNEKSEILHRSLNVMQNRVSKWNVVGKIGSKTLARHRAAIKPSIEKKQYLKSNII